MNPTTLLWSFLGTIFCLFVLVVVVVVLVWDRAEDSGKAKGRGEMAQEIGELLNENKRLKGLIANGPMQYLLTDGERAPRQLGAGMEYTRTDKWKALPDGGK